MRLSKAKARALASPGLSTGGTARIKRALDTLDQMATTTRARRAVASFMTHLQQLSDPRRLLDALDSTLGVRARFDSDDFTALVRRSTRAADPVGYLDDVRWLAELDAPARHALAARIAGGRSPDLTWLRSADLAKKDLQALVADPTTDWAMLQRHAQRAENVPDPVRAVLGIRADELTILPAGTELWRPAKGHPRRLRWQRGRANGRPSLTVDSLGRIAIGGENTLNRAALGRNMRKRSAKLLGHHDHHIIPIAIARDHELFRLARERGRPAWDPNHPDNGIQLPANARARDAVTWSRELPIHSGRHVGYSDLVIELVNRTTRRLKVAYKSLDRVPPRELTAAAKYMEQEMRRVLVSWKAQHGDKLK